MATGVIFLTVSGGYQSQKMGACFPSHHLGGDFDPDKIMRPVQVFEARSTRRAACASGS